MSDKAKVLAEKRRKYFAFLDQRIPELHKSGVKGRDARTQADAEWAKR